MRLDKTRVIARREYLARIRSKGFWLGTVILPLFLAGMFVLPAYVLSKSTSHLDVALVDGTGLLGPGIAERLSEGGTELGSVAKVSVAVEPAAPDSQAQRRSLDRRLLAGKIGAWIWIDSKGLAAGKVEYHARSVSNTLTQSILERAISAEVRKMRLTRAGYDPAAVGPLLAPVELETVKVSKEGSRAEAGEAGFFLAYGLFFLLYMILLIWGQQVLQGVLEEKSSRVVEVIVSSARPQELMMGKLIGIGGAALTQFSIWLATAVALTAPAVVASIAFVPAGFAMPSLTVAQALTIVVFFLLGFFVYASVYAAVGSSFNNAQEAQQLAWLPSSMIILPIFFMFPVINDSSSTMAVVTSLIPPLTPILMPLRIAVEMPPVWQILLAIALTTLFVYGMVRLCGRIYRVGILMYGKKPTLAEIVRWARHA